MGLQVSAGVKAFAADGAAVGSDPQVTPHVHPERRAESEAPPTDCAGVEGFVAVNACMYVQIFSANKASAARVAQEPLLSVTFLVRRQQQLRAVTFPTNITAERAWHVSALVNPQDGGACEALVAVQTLVAGRVSSDQVIVQVREEQGLSPEALLTQRTAERRWLLHSLPGRPLLSDSGPGRRPGRPVWESWVQVFSDRGLGPLVWDQLGLVCGDGL